MTNTQECRWRIFSTSAELRDVAVKNILDTASQAIAGRGRFDIVLAGGTTPREIYEQLRSAQSDWQHWHVWFGDERCLPMDDPERNSVMASQALLSHVPIPAEQVYLIPAELGAPVAAAAYSTKLAGVGPFDLVLLGVGEDGHTASLFPGHVWDQTPLTAAIPVKNSPKPPSERVSLSADRLSNARQVIFIVTGESKREAVKQWRGNVKLPVRAIVPKAGVDVFMDAVAAAA